MARRKSDPRVTIQALPPLVRVKGKPPIAKLNLACALEKCDKSGCDKHPEITWTVPGEGTIKRYCKEHYFQYRGTEEIKLEQARVIHWALSKMSNKKHEWKVAVPK